MDTLLLILIFGSEGVEGEGVLHPHQGGPVLVAGSVVEGDEVLELVGPGRGEDVEGGPLDQVGQGGGQHPADEILGHLGLVVHPAAAVGAGVPHPEGWVGE